MPGFENYCDKHVPRGCSCNLELKEEFDADSREAEDPKNYYEPLDEQGRRYPCVEYFSIGEDLHNDKEYIKLVLEDYRKESIEWDHNEY